MGYECFREKVYFFLPLSRVLIMTIPLFCGFCNRILPLTYANKICQISPYFIAKISAKWGHVTYRIALQLTAISW